jgi:hypothetical protein
LLTDVFLVSIIIEMWLILKEIFGTFIP